MKKLSALFLALVCFLSIAGCGGPEEERHWAVKPTVMIDGIKYGTTGRSITYYTWDAPQNGGYYDGEITSTVEAHESPTENDQSNFGIGYKYRYGEDNTVLVFIENEYSGNWVIYEAYEDQGEDE